MTASTTISIYKSRICNITKTNRVIYMNNTTINSITNNPSIYKARTTYIKVINIFNINNTTLNLSTTD